MTHKHSQTPPRAIILSAGQGKRLLPLTQDCPKCLLPVAGKTILEWQIDHLQAAGINDITIVTGFGTPQVEALLKDRYPGRGGVRILHNPFYEMSDNLVSCWVAREAMNSGFLLLNGDTLFEQALLNRVLASPRTPVTLTVDHKDQYDEDDMKVELEEGRVAHVSKTLPVDRIQAESIGLLYFRDTGPALFRDTVEQFLRDPSGLKVWYLSVIDNLASRGQVWPCPISGCRWAEIDDRHDLEEASLLFARVDQADVPVSAETGTEKLQRTSV